MWAKQEVLSVHVCFRSSKLTLSVAKANIKLEVQNRVGPFRDSVAPRPVPEEDALGREEKQHDSSHSPCTQLWWDHRCQLQSCQLTFLWALELLVKLQQRSCVFKTMNHSGLDGIRLPVWNVSRIRIEASLKFLHKHRNNALCKLMRWDKSRNTILKLCII